MAKPRLGPRPDGEDRDAARAGRRGCRRPSRHAGGRGSARRAGRLAAPAEDEAAAAVAVRIKEANESFTLVNE